MPQYQLALDTWERLPVCKHDENSSGVQRIVQKPEEIPLWATFDIHLFLDIQTVLGDKQSMAFDEIHKEANAWVVRCLKPDGMPISDLVARNDAIPFILGQFEAQQL
jgi:hypothetical protein